MSDLSTFPFINLPLEIQVIVINKLSFRDVIHFRTSCRHFFNLTDNHYHQQASNGCAKRIKYISRKHEFQLMHYDANRYVDTPTSEFINKLGYNIQLIVIEVHEDDQNNFMEKLRNNPLKFHSLSVTDIPLSLMENFLCHLNYLEHYYIDFSKLYTNDLLCSDAMKHLKGTVIISGLRQANGKFNYDIDPSLQPTKGINHVIKQWIEGDYQFDHLTLKPISMDTRMDSLFEGVPYIWIFNCMYHHSTLLRDLPYDYVKGCIKWCVVVKQRNSTQCCLVIVYTQLVILVPCSEQEAMQKALKILLKPELEPTYPEHILIYLCQQKLF